MEEGKREESPKSPPLTVHAALGGESQDCRGGNLRSDIWGIAYILFYFIS